MQTYFCRNSCCTIKIKKYQHTQKNFNKNTKKAGVFIYDPQEERILLVQSRGNLWGPPKGTIEIGENETECAIREVKEETGLDISSGNFTRYVKLSNKAICYYLEMKTCDVSVQDSNDATGIMWIKIKCLEKAISKGDITINHYAKFVFNSFITNFNFTNF